MKKLYHICITSHDEVMFRNKEDYGEAVNCLGLALFKTGSLLYADSFMSNHIHFSVLTEEPMEFVKSFRVRYTMYFNKKYNRHGPLGDSYVFCTELEGPRHILAAWSYIFRNGLHHGLADTAFDYEHSSVNCIFKDKLGKQDSGHSITSRAFIKKCLPRYSEFPDNYQMNEHGYFTRESLTQVTQVQLQYSTPRSFLYYMNRLSGEEWEKEQSQDENMKEPITLELIERGCSKIPISKLMSNENGRNSDSSKSDTKVCAIIDSVYVPRYKRASVYCLSDEEKALIAKALRFDYHISQEQIQRCLIIK